MRELTSTAVDINVGFLADEDSHTTADTTDGGQSDPNIALTLNVSVENTQDMREALSGDNVAWHFYPNSPDSPPTESPVPT